MFGIEPHKYFNVFPSEIRVYGNILEHEFRYKLSKIQGYAKNSSLNDRVFIKNTLDSEINELKSENLVIYYKIVN
jgi:hypothetical protein